MMTEVNADAPFIQPPEWALLERSLIDLMNQSAAPLLEKYVRPDGTILWPTIEEFSSIDGLDDAYESFHNWPLFYLLGGDSSFLDHSHRQWEAITRQFARYDSGHGHPMVVKEYEQGYDWMHQGEGYVFFYLLCLADPANQRNVERACRYAGFFTGRDPEAPNYDRDKRLIRSPHNGSMGPAWHNFEKFYTRYAYSSWKPWPLPYLDIPGIETVEDLRDPANELKMGAALVARMARGDAAVNLAATSLVANAYLAGGGEEHRAWVREYLEAWIERAGQNGGLLPDNVGLSGKIGECMDGKWYGGYYGWTWPHGWHTLGEAPLSAVENAALLWRDRSYFEFYRGQLDRLIEQGRMEGDTLQVPHFYNDRGWDGYSPLSARYLAHLWTLSMAEEDLERIRRTRDHHSRDYQRVIPLFTKHSGGHEAPWLSYLMGEYPEYPVEILRHNHAQVYQRLAFMRDDTQDPSTYGDWYLQVRNPITVEGLVQLTMGGPLFNYNGGLLLVRLRYFDAQTRRPGLPPQVAALVEKLEDKRAVLHLVNLSATQDRRVVVQGGAFGEHRFTKVKYRTRGRVGELSPHWTDTQYREKVEAALEERVVEVNGKHFAVRLAPGSGVTLDLGMERFVNDPSCALPW
jgi:hypothetical protein